jgi:hypothetical protein
MKKLEERGRERGRERGGEKRVYERIRFWIREEDWVTTGKKKRDKEYCRMGNRDAQIQCID